MYYAAFYATVALLLYKNIEVKSHNGVKQKLGEEIILKGILPRQYGKTFSVLSDYRHKGDYDDLFNFDIEIVEPLILSVKEYIDAIEGVIKQ